MNGLTAPRPTALVVFFFFDKMILHGSQWAVLSQCKEGGPGFALEVQWIIRSSAQVLASRFSVGWVLPSLMKP